MILSDIDIKNEIEEGNIAVDPLLPDTVRENGLDLRVDNHILRETMSSYPIHLDNQSPCRFKKVHVKNKIIIRSHEFLLLSTHETIKLSDEIVGFCNIRSTVARSGIMCPPTIIDAGFRGKLTIEIFNASKKDIVFRVGDRFLHVVLSYTNTPCENPYNGVYQGQNIVTPPKKAI